jgi:hypothetical protein
MLVIPVQAGIQCLALWMGRTSLGPGLRLKRSSSAEWLVMTNLS